MISGESNCVLSDSHWYQAEEGTMISTGQSSLYDMAHAIAVRVLPSPYI